jgi:hypothetical protein
MFWQFTIMQVYRYDLPIRDTTFWLRTRGSNILRVVSVSLLLISPSELLIIKSSSPSFNFNIDLLEFIVKLNYHWIYYFVYLI